MIAFGHFVAHFLIWCIRSIVQKMEIGCNAMDTNFKTLVLFSASDLINSVGTGNAVTSVGNQDPVADFEALISRSVH